MLPSNRVYFKADLIFGKRKSHRALNQVNTARVQELERLWWLNNTSQTGGGQVRCPGARFAQLRPFPYKLALSVLPILANTKFGL